MYTSIDKKGGQSAGGPSNPALRSDTGPSGSVGIGRPTGSSSAARPISDDFSSHPDEIDASEKQKKRLYIIMAVLGILALAFLIIAIVMIVLYVNEKDKTVYPEVKPEMINAHPYYFSFIDYTREFTATQEPNISDYRDQINKAARAAYPPESNFGVGHVSVDNALKIPEMGMTYSRAVVSATVVLVEIDLGAKSSRKKRAAQEFPTLAAFNSTIGDKIGPFAILSTSDTTKDVCGTFSEPTVLPNPPTTVTTRSSTVSGATVPATTPTTLTTTTRTTTTPTTTNPCPTTSSTSCPACPPQTSPTTLTSTSCPPPPTTPVCPTQPPTTCAACPSCSTEPPTTSTGNPHTKLTIPPDTGTTTVAPADDRCKFDLVFIVDESESVGQFSNGSQNWQLIKDAMKGTTDPSILKISLDDTRMAWVGFSSKTYTEADQIQLLMNSISNDQTSEAIDKLNFHPGGSNAYSAFLFTQNTLLNASFGARKDPQLFKELLILISDGNYKTWDHPIPASSVAKQIRDQNEATIYAVSISETGHDIDPDNLVAITGSANNTYRIDNYGLLKAKIQQIINQTTCVKPQNATVCRGDLILVVDRSESVDDDNFAALKQFLARNFTNLFPIDGDKQYRMALVTFSDDARVEFYLSDKTTNTEITDAINKVEYYHPGATNTSGALNTVIKDVLQGPHYKPLACSGTVIVLFTDGIHDVDVDPKGPAEVLRSAPFRATIVSVGIGPKVVQQELNDISGSPDLVYTYTDFTHLGTNFSDFVQSHTCTPYHQVLVPCNDPHDVAIVVDFHNGLTVQEFESIRTYVQYLSTGFYLDDGQIHLSMVTYGSQVVNSTAFQRWTNADLFAYIGKLNRDTIAGDPTTGLTAALKLLNNTAHTPRQEKLGYYNPDVIIIITTQPTDYSPQLGDSADQLLKDRYTQIIGIAAGDTYPDHTTADVLRYIARSDGVVEFDSLLEFESELCLNNNNTQYIVNKTCLYYPPPTPAPTQCYTVCSDSTPATTTTFSPTTTPTRGTPPPTRTTRAVSATPAINLRRMSGDGQRTI